MTRGELKRAIRTAERVFACVPLTPRQNGTTKISKACALRLIHHLPPATEVTTAMWLDDENTMLIIGTPHAGA